jgi:hypothetical protein
MKLTKYRGQKAVVLLVVLLSFCLVFPVPGWSQLSEASLAKSVQALRNLTGIRDAELLAARDRLREMGYTENRIFQALARLPHASSAQVPVFLDVASRYGNLRFSYVPLFDRFVALTGVRLADCRRLLVLLEETSFMQEQALTPLVGTQIASGEQFLRIVSKTLALTDTGLWAANGLFGQAGLSAPIADQALDLLAGMTNEQQRTAERYLRRHALELRRILSDLRGVGHLDGSNIFNFRALCTNENILAGELSQWLFGFFLLPLAEQQNVLQLMAGQKRKILLEAYQHAAVPIIWQINNLHSVTDPFGQEIGTTSLTKMSSDSLAELFSHLPEKARLPYAKGFNQSLTAGRRSAAIAELRAATAAARRYTGEELTDVNLYVLLANGGEFYTSSFREIVAPILLARIKRDFQGQLLDFLRMTDADGRYVSDFVTNLAQKGMLVDYLPRGGDEQGRIVDLVADSALADESSLILFSATFANLLQTFVPEVRERLIEHLLQAAVNDDQHFSRQVRVILQYYFHTFPKLLSSEARDKIAVLLATLGEIDLQEYILTPFGEWRDDGRLASISTFAGDDDGWSSYVSYSRDLLSNGYSPAVSERYRLAAVDMEKEEEVARTVGSLRKSPTSSISTLFSFAIRQPLVIEWRKNVHGITISHGLYVFIDADHQQRLLEIFLREGDEMFAQRGHSYYRNSQLLSPLRTLLKEGKIDIELLGSKRRFVSLGSCGGIKAYSRINGIFQNNVDIFGTVGTGTAVVNNSFNRRLLEIGALPQPPRTWQQVEAQLGGDFGEGQASGEYIVPGSLPAILHKMSKQAGSMSVADFDDEP